jgi:endonuclease/exonuclease/phosphatase family metal-dependent hydrolase
MPRCSALLALVLAAALGPPAGAAQTIPPVGTAATFDVATWNVERFGNSSAGPSDDQLQRENVQAVIAQSGVDLWALQEINDVTDWNLLVAALDPDFAGVLGPSVSGSPDFDLRLAYVYDPDVVSVISSGEVTEGMDEFNFANGRFPFQLRAAVSLPGGASFELYVLDVHMLSGDTPSDYSRRVGASQELKAYVDGLLAGGARVIVLGDLNDELLMSISGSPFSPYANFLADDDYLFLTEPFDQPGEGDDRHTFCFNTACTSGSVLDHLILTDNLGGDYVPGSVGRHTALLDAFDDFGGEYVTTTSDHLPVYARFDLRSVADEPAAPPLAFALGAPYPNPFTETATLTYTLDRSGPVRLELFDALGRRVSVIEDDARPAGTYRVRFNGNALTPGLYVVRLTSGDQVATRRLVRGNGG